MTELKQKRKVVRKTLTDTFGKERASLLEKNIFIACKRIRDDLVESTSSKSTTLSSVYSTFSFQKCGELLINPESDDNNIDYNNVGWNSPIFHVYSDNEKRDTETQVKGPCIREGEFQCASKTCRSFKCYHYQKQTRRGDEGFTTYVVCSVCGEKYHFN